MEQNEAAATTEFDLMAAKFTSEVSRAANWKNEYGGALYATRIRSAIMHLKSAIVDAERHPEIGTR